MKILLIASLAAWAAGPLGQPSRLPDFTLRSSSGKSVGLKDLLGRPWVADFIFTRCAGQCPAMTTRMRDLRRRLPGLRLVSISVDPTDGPARLEKYKKDWGADWLFLSGGKKAVRRLCQNGFHLAVGDGGPATEPVTHSNRLVLVDAAGDIAGYYDGMDPAAVDALARDAAAQGSR